jgi:hypothetical protein
MMRESTREYGQRQVAVERGGPKLGRITEAADVGS